MILAFGTEMGFFLPADANAIEEAAASTYDTSFSRGAARVLEGSTYVESPDIGATLLNAWIHFNLAGTVARTAGASDDAVFIWHDDGGTARIKMTYDHTTNNLKLWYDIGAGYVQVGSTFTIELVTSGGGAHMQTFDINVVCNSAGGSIALYTSGTERINASVNTSAISQLNKARWFADTDDSAYEAKMHVSEVVIADEPTVGMRVMTMYASGAGNDTAWTGSYTDIDEAVYSDADFINSSVADQVETFAGTPVSSIAALNIRAVCVTARARRGASGPQNIQLALRSGGTNYFSATKTLDIGYTSKYNVWETDPFTGIAWTSTDAAAIQFGVKSIA